MGERGEALGESARGDERELAGAGEEAGGFVGANPVEVGFIGEDDVDILIGEVGCGGGDDFAGVGGIAEGVDDEAGSDVTEIGAEAGEAFGHDHGPADGFSLMTDDEAVEVGARGRVHAAEMGEIGRASCRERV